MDTYGDASYMQFIAQAGLSTYMMPVSPGFYTNLPFYDKNWLWRGDDLWYDRWTDFVAPEFAQIISWNDYGESHYIGPLNSKALYAFDTGLAPFNYASGVPHDGYRMFLPFLIQLAKTGTATVGTQGVAVWYRNAAGSACDFSGTVGNTCTQLQLEYSPADIVQDKVFYSALLGASAAVTVTVGGVSLGATWTDVPPTGVGVYHGSASFKGHSRQVVVTVNGIASVVGTVPIGGCTRQNFNPYVYSANGPSSGASLNINNHVWVAGFGIGNFQNICKFSCGIGYCPVTGGTGVSAKYKGMCEFSCRYGWCPMHLCTYSSIGVLIPVPAINPSIGTFRPTLSMDEFLLCRFTSIYGKASSDVCWEPEPEPEPMTAPAPAPAPTAEPVPMQTWWLWTSTTNLGSGSGSPATDIYTFF
ncbi:Glucan endo-1,3-alpha-glucosidase agn1 [Neonectria punicea]|uniref:Glucan endo-1,3-alpha-glucosidase agn1 n=1 Tax=Neonectria punicea TaxID=979145 RepID=A0ABR1H1S9_9HYPO